MKKKIIKLSERESMLRRERMCWLNMRASANDILFELMFRSDRLTDQGTRPDPDVINDIIAINGDIVRYDNIITRYNARIENTTEEIQTLVNTA